MQITEGFFFLAKSNKSLIILSESLCIHLVIILQAKIKKNYPSSSDAIAFNNKVLYVPGGP